MEHFSVEWQAPEFEYREKDISWYWLSAIIAVVLLSVSVWQNNFLFGVFIIMAEILVLVWATKKPRTINFRMDEKGLTIDGRKFYPYSTIQSFGIRENPAGEWTELAFQFAHGLRPLMKIMIPSKRAAEAEDALKPLVEKTEFEESFLDALQKFTGF